MLVLDYLALMVEIRSELSIGNKETHSFASRFRWGNWIHPPMLCLWACMSLCVCVFTAMTGAVVYVECNIQEYNAW